MCLAFAVVHRAFQTMPAYTTLILHLFLCSTLCIPDNASLHNTQSASLSLQYIVLSRQCQPTQHSFCISFSVVHCVFQTMPAYTTLSLHLFLCSTSCFPDNASLHNTQSASLSLQYIVYSRQCQPTQHSVCISFSVVHRAFHTMPAHRTDTQSSGHTSSRQLTVPLSPKSRLK